MAITQKKKLFAQAKREGKSNTDAAIFAGYSADTAPQAGSRLAKDKDVIGEIGRKEKIEVAKEVAKETGIRLDIPDLGVMYKDPKDFLMAVMNDVESDMKTRSEAAKALMPFIHQKKGESGKKEVDAENAKKIASRFSAVAAPKLVAVKK